MREDEWLLYLHGAVLGFGAGLVHLAIFGVTMSDDVTSDATPDRESESPGDDEPAAGRPGLVRIAAGRLVAHRPGGRWAHRLRGGLARGARGGLGRVAGRALAARPAADAARLRPALARASARTDAPASRERAGLAAGRRAGHRRCASAAPSCCAGPPTSTSRRTRTPPTSASSSELAPDEARILRLLALEGPQPAVDVRSGGCRSTSARELVAPGLTMIGAEAGCRHLDRVPAYLNNLYRLGLIWFSREPLEDPLRYQVLEAQPEVTEAMREAGRAPAPCAAAST